MPEVSAVVPCRDAATTLPRCLDALRDELGSRGEIILVDDGSTDGSADIARDRVERVIRLTGVGAARARNAGAAAAAAPVLLFIDADVVVRSGSVSALLAAIASGHDACFGAYAPLPPPGFSNGPTLFKNLQQHYTHTRAPSPVRSFWSGLGAVRAEAFAAVGGFDPDATDSADVEDIDLGYRLSAEGYSVVPVPTALADHLKTYSFAGMVRSDVMHRAAPWVRTMIRTRRAHAELNLSPGPVAGSAALLVAVAALLRAVVGGPSRSGVALAGFGLGIWAAAHAGFFRFAVRAAGLRGAVVVPLQLVYGLYAPVGAALGVIGEIADRVGGRRP